MATAKRKATTTTSKKPARKHAGKTTTRKSSPGKGKLKFAEQAQENARNVFLAGLGVYGKAREEAQSQLEENRAKAEELFSELVKRGEKVETTARKKIKKLDLPELKIPDSEQLRARLDKARASFDTLRDAIKPGTP